MTATQRCGRSPVAAGLTLTADLPVATVGYRVAAHAKRLDDAALPVADATALVGLEAKIVHRVKTVRQEYVKFAKVV